MELENNIQDPRISGTQGIRGIRANDSGDSVRDNYFDVVNKHAAIATQSRHNLANHITEPQELAMGPQTVNLSDLPEDSMLSEYGKSKYDDPFTFQFSDEAIKDRRAENQWGITKIGLGVAKGAITAGTTFLNNTGGLIYGAYQGISNKGDNNDNTNFIDGLWNNDITRATKAVSDWMEDTFKIYSSTKEDEAPWYSLDYLTSGAFLGDTLIKNLGFMVGSFYSGGMFTKGLSFIPKALGAISKSTKVAKSAQGAIGAALSAVGEGSIEAINKTDSWKKEAVENLKFKNAQTLKQIESERPYLTAEQYEAKKVQADEAYKAGLQQIERDVIKMGNMDLMLNIPILIFSNLVSWGKLYSSGFKTARYANAIKQTAKNVGKGDLKAAINGLENSIKKPTARGVARTLNRMRVEGIEEMNQGWADEVSGLVAENDVMAYYKSKLNGDAYEDTYKDWHSKVSNLGKQSAEAFANTYGNLDNWEEFAVSAISSVFGMPKVRSFRNAETGKWQSPITFEGGIAQDIKDAHKEAGENQQIIDYLKGRLDDPAFLESFEHATAHQAWDYVMQGAARDGNQKKFNDAKVNQMINDLYALQKAGLLDVAKTLIETGSDININTEAGQRDLDYVKANDKSEVEVPNDPLDPSKGTHKEIFSARGWFDKDGNQIKSDPEIVEDIKSRKDEILKYVKQFEKVTNDLDNDTAGVFSDDQLKELAWLQMRVFDDYDRVGSILNDIQRKNTYNLQDILDNQKANGKLSEEKYNELTEKLNSTLDSLDFKDLTAEKWHKLIKKNPELVDVLNYFGGLSESNFKSKDLYQQFQDIFGLQKDIKQFEKTFNEFKENPGLLRAQIDQVRNDARKKKVEETAKKWEESLSRAKDLDEFEEMYSASELLFESFDEEEGDKYREWFNDYLSKSTDKNVADYFSRMRNKERYVKSYSNAISKINNLDFSDFSNEDRDLLSMLDSDALQFAKGQLEEIFKPLFDGLSFEEAKSQILENLKNVLNNPNVVNTKELSALAFHILDKLEDDEKIHQSKQQEEKKNQEETSVKNDSDDGFDILNDTDENGNKPGKGNDENNSPESPEVPAGSPKPENGGGSGGAVAAEEDEEVDTSSLQEQKTKLDSAFKRVKDLLVNGETQQALDAYNNQLVPEFNAYEKETTRLGLNSSVISGVYRNDLRDLKNQIDNQLKEDEEHAKAQQNGSDSKKDSNTNDLLDKINLLDINELQNLLDGKTTTKLGEEINILIHFLPEDEQKQIYSIIKAKIDEASFGVVVSSSDSDTDDSDFKDDSAAATNTQSTNETPDEKSKIVRPVLKSWTETFWDFFKLINNKFKTRYAGSSQSVPFLQRYNAFDFIDKGLLAMISNKYEKTHSNKKIPIHFLASKSLIDSTSKQPRRQPILGIEIDDSLLQYFNEITSRYLGSTPELVEIDGKRYYPVGVLGFYGKNIDPNGASRYATIQGLMYGEIDPDTKQRILFADTGKDWYVSKYTTEIANIFSGRLYTMSDDIPANSIRPLSKTKFNDTSKLIFGVKNRTGEIITPQTTAEVADLKQNPNSRLGSTWILIRGGDGKLYPTATKIARFNSSFKWTNDENQNKPIIQKILDLARIVCDSTKPDIERSKAKFLFERILGFPTDYMGNVINPIVFKSGTDIISIKPITGFKTSEIKGDNLDELVNSFMNAMMEANYKFNISLAELKSSELTDSRDEYLQFVIDSDIVFTNLIEPSFAAASFEIQPLTKDGTIDKQTAPHQGAYDSSNSSSSAYVKIEYQNGYFEYDDSGKVLNDDLSNEFKKAAEDIYNISRDSSKYDGEYHGGIYHKDGDSYCIELSGASAYTVHVKSDPDYERFINKYETARTKDNKTQAEQNADDVLDGLKPQEKNETGGGNTGKVVGGLFEGHVKYKGKRVSEMTDEEKSEGIALATAMEEDMLNNIAKLLGVSELSDEAILALIDLENGPLSLDNVNSIDKLNELLDTNERCYGGGKFRFKKPSSSATKRKPGSAAKNFGRDLE